MIIKKELVPLCIGLLIGAAFVSCNESDISDPSMTDDKLSKLNLNGDPPEDPSLTTIPGESVSSNIEGTSISFEPPKISEEENFSVHIPDHLRCDSCHAVTYQIAMGIAQFQADKGWGENKAPESDVAELFEEICEQHRYENYGIKEIDGINRLSGVGLPTADSPGMMQGGGKWPHRLSIMCLEFVGDLDEYFIYKAFMKAGPGVLEDLESLLCSNELYSSTRSCINGRVEPVAEDERGNHDEL